MFRVKHVPIRQADLSYEQRIVRNVDQMYGVGFRLVGEKVFGSAGDGSGFVSIQIFGRMAANTVLA